MSVGPEHAIDFIAGLLGGCAGIVFGHAFDTVKVRQQTLSAKHGRGAYHAIRTTLVHDGLLGFYKGMAFPLVTVGGLNSIFFGVYGNTIRSVTSQRYGDSARARPTYLDVFLVGGFSGGVQAIPATTIELVKVKLQSQSAAGIPQAAMSSKYRGPISSVAFHIHRDHGMHGIFRGISKNLARHKTLMQPMSKTPEAPTLYRGPIHCLRSMARDHGLRGCFTGLQATLLREVPGFSVYMIMYEFMLDLWTPGRADLPRGVVCDLPQGVLSWGDARPLLEDCLPDPSVSVLLLAGGLAGTASWIGNIPFDVIKSRLQADNMSSPRYKNYLDCVVKSYKSDGIRVFWRGLPVVMLRSFPVNAVTFAVYDTTMRVMQRMHRDRAKLE